MNSPSDGSQREEKFLGEFVAKMNPELYMGDQIQTNVNAPGDKANGQVSNNILQKLRDGVIKV